MKMTENESNSLPETLKSIEVYNHCHLPIAAGILPAAAISRDHKHPGPV